MFRTQCLPRLASRLYNISHHSNRLSPYMYKQQENRSLASLAPLRASDLEIEETKNPKKLSDAKDLVFGHTFTGTHTNRL